MEKEKVKNYSDKSWRRIKMLSGIFAACILPLFGYFITDQYNKKQLEITRAEKLANIIQDLATKEIDAKKKKALALSMAIFQKMAIPPLIAFLQEDEKDVRRAASQAIEIIGIKSVPYLEKYLLDDFIPAKYKSEALLALYKINKKASRQVGGEIINKISKDNIFPKDKKNDINYDPFIHQELVYVLYKIGLNLKNSYLQGIEFTDKQFNNLEGINLKGAILRNAKFTNNNLRSACFEEANLEEAIFQDCDIENAHFEKADYGKEKPFRNCDGEAHF